jgi:hypothetical protein
VVGLTPAVILPVFRTGPASRRRGKGLRAGCGSLSSRVRAAEPGIHSRSRRRTKADGPAIPRSIVVMDRRLRGDDSEGVAIGGLCREGNSRADPQPVRHEPPAGADRQMSKSMRLRAGAVWLQPEGLLEGWRERRSGSMLVDDEEPERPSRTVLLGEQATRTCRSSAQAGLTAVRPAWGCGQARRTAWASCQGVARSPARPCSAPASCDASRARPSGRRTDTRYSLAWMSCQEQSENIAPAS